RHPHQHQRRSHSLYQRHFPRHRRPRRQRPRHHRRLHAPHPPVGPHEQIPRHRPSHRVLHLHCFQRRRLPHPRRRPAPVPRLFAWCRFLVGRAARLVHLAHRHRRSARHVLFPRRPQLRSRPETTPRRNDP